MSKPKPKIHARIYKGSASAALFFLTPMVWCIEIQYPDRIDYRYAESWTIAMGYANTLIREYTRPMGGEIPRSEMDVLDMELL